MGIDARPDPCRPEHFGQRSSTWRRSIPCSSRRQSAGYPYLDCHCHRNDLETEKGACLLVHMPVGHVPAAPPVQCRSRGTHSAGSQVPGTPSHIVWLLASTTHMSRPSGGLDSTRMFAAMQERPCSCAKGASQGQTRGRAVTLKRR